MKRALSLLLVIMLIITGTGFTEYAPESSQDISDSLNEAIEGEGNLEPEQKNSDKNYPAGVNDENQPKENSVGAADDAGKEAPDEDASDKETEAKDANGKETAEAASPQNTAGDPVPFSNAVQITSVGGRAVTATGELNFPTTTGSAAGISILDSTTPGKVKALGTNTIEEGESVYIRLVFAALLGPIDILNDMNDNFTLSIEEGGNWVDSVQFAVMLPADGGAERAFVEIETKTNIASGSYTGKLKITAQNNGSFRVGSGSDTRSDVTIPFTVSLNGTFIGNNVSLNKIAGEEVPPNGQISAIGSGKVYIADQIAGPDKLKEMGLSRLYGGDKIYFPIEWDPSAAPDPGDYIGDLNVNFALAPDFGTTWISSVSFELMEDPVTGQQMPFIAAATATGGDEDNPSGAIKITTQNNGKILDSAASAINEATLAFKAFFSKVTRISSIGGKTIEASGDHSKRTSVAVPSKDVPAELAEDDSSVVEGGSKFYVRVVFASGRSTNNPVFMHENYDLSIESGQDWITGIRFVTANKTGEAPRIYIEADTMPGLEPGERTASFKITTKSNGEFGSGTSLLARTELVVPLELAMNEGGMPLTTQITSVGYKSIGESSSIDILRLAKFNEDTGLVDTEVTPANLKVIPGEDFYVRLVTRNTSRPVEELEERFEIVVTKGGEYVEFLSFERLDYEAINTPRNFLKFKIKDNVQAPKIVDLEFKLVCKPGGVLGTAGNSEVAAKVMFMASFKPTGPVEEGSINLTGIATKPVLPFTTAFADVFGYYTASSQSAGTNHPELKFEPGRSLYFLLQFSGEDGYTVPKSLHDIKNKISISKKSILEGNKYVKNVRLAQAKLTSAGDKWSVWLVVETNDLQNTDGKNLDMTVTLSMHGNNAIAGVPGSDVDVRIAMDAEHNIYEAIGSNQIVRAGDNKVFKFEKEAENVTILLKEDIVIEGDMSGQWDMYIKMITTSTSLEPKYPHASLRLFTNAGKLSAFARYVTITIPYHEGIEKYSYIPFLYKSDMSGNLEEIKNAYDKEQQAFVFKTKTLDRYVLSEIPLTGIDYLVPFSEDYDPNRQVKVSSIGSKKLSELSTNKLDDYRIARYNSETRQTILEEKINTFTPGETLYFRVMFETNFNARNLREMEKFKLNILKGGDFIEDVSFKQMPYNNADDLVYRIFIAVKTKKSIKPGTVMNSEISITGLKNAMLGGKTNSSITIPIKLNADLNSLKEAVEDAAKGKYLNIMSIGYKSLDNFKDFAVEKPSFKAGRYNAEDKTVAYETPLKAYTPGETLYYRLALDTSHSTTDVEKLAENYKLSAASGGEFISGVSFVKSVYDDNGKPEDKLFIAVKTNGGIKTGTTANFEIKLEAAGYNRLAGVEDASVIMPISVKASPTGLNDALKEAAKGKYQNISGIGAKSIKDKGGVIIDTKAARYDAQKETVMYETPLEAVTPGETLYLRIAYFNGYSTSDIADLEKNFDIGIIKGAEYVEKLSFVKMKYDTTKKISDTTFIAVKTKSNIPMGKNISINVSLAAKGHSKLDGTENMAIVIPLTAYTSATALKEALVIAARGRTNSISAIGGKKIENLSETAIPAVKVAEYDRTLGYVNREWAQLAYTPGGTFYIRLAFSGSKPDKISDMNFALNVIKGEDIIESLSFAELPYYNGSEVKDAYFIAVKTKDKLPDTRKISMEIAVKGLGYDSVGTAMNTAYTIPLTMYVRGMSVLDKKVVVKDSSQSDADGDGETSSTEDNAADSPATEDFEE